MSEAKIFSYRQNRPAFWLEKNPDQTWRCDIYSTSGSEHHAIGATEAVAIVRAVQHYCNWEISKYTSQVAPEVE